MKFTIAITLLTLLSALSKPASATEWPSIEIQKSCPKSIKEVWKDGTAAYYGCGGRTSEAVVKATQGNPRVAIPPYHHRQIATEVFKEYGLPAEEVIAQLTGLLYNHLSLMEKRDHPPSYEKADALFQELLSLAAATKKSGLLGWWSYLAIGDHGTVSSILASIAQMEPYRYGLKIIGFYEYITEQYPEDQLMSWDLPLIIKSAIEGLGVARNWRQGKVKVDAEKTKENRQIIRILAEKFFLLYHGNSYLTTNVWLEEILELAAPDVLQELKRLQEEQKQAALETTNVTNTE